MLSQSTRYYLPEPSHWPVMGSCALLLMAIGAVLWMNGVAPGPWVVLAGMAVLVYMMFGWFGTVIRESEGGSFNKQVDGSFRWGMSWFIFSEVMFFAAFFGALTGRYPVPESKRPSRRWAPGGSPRSTR